MPGAGEQQAEDGTGQGLGVLVLDQEAALAVAEQSSASAEEVSATAEQTSASTQQIAASAQELATTAEHLQGLVAQFNLA